MPLNFIENYGIETDRYDKEIDKHLSNVVSSFTQIGIEDPFPQEEYKFEEDIPEVCYEPTVQPETEKIRWSKLIVDECRINMEDCSPECLYIPSKQVLLKLMRACIDVKDESELWFNRIPTPPESSEEENDENEEEEEEEKDQSQSLSSSDEDKQ